MSKILPLDEKALASYADDLAPVKASLGFVPNSLKTMARVPELMKRFSALVGFVMGPGKVDIYLKDLVSYIASNASGCRYCQAHTIGSAAKNGASEAQLRAVWSFEQSDLFSEKEKSALRFGLASGSVPNGVTPEHFADLRKHFSEAQIIELGGVVSVFGYLNRWNDSFGTPLEKEAETNAGNYLSESGWKIEKHK